jgi:exodeoxyribonuclease-5
MEANLPKPARKLRIDLSAADDSPKELTLQEINRLVFDLPDYVEKVLCEKRQASAPDINTLKEQQLAAYIAMTEFLSEPGGGMFLLKGYAGSGKTFTISRVMEWVLQNKRVWRIAVTAPTNKAVKVLADASDFQHSSLKYSTIHSLLGLKEQIDGYGNQNFVPDKKYAPAIEKYQVLIIDEVSMLNDDLFLMVEAYVRLGMKIIFMGDPAQIPPVGKKDCIPFSVKGQKDYNIKVMTLTEIVRQAADNPIIATTMAIRSAIGRPNTFPILRNAINPDGTGVIMLQKGNPEHSEFVEQYLERYFNSDNFKNDSDFMKVICWTNKVVNRMNTWIRVKVYGSEEARARIVKGEKLIVNKPILEEEMVIWTTNDEFEVVDYTERIEEINDGQFQLKYYAAEVRGRGSAEGHEKSSIVKIIHEESMETYALIVQALIDNAKAVRQGSWQAATAWKEVYDFQQTFADVNYNYAITAHKSQGSTYENVLVLCQDIDANRDVTERNRIKYTACSRPRTRLVLVI